MHVASQDPRYAQNFRVPDEYDKLPELVEGLSEDHTELSPHLEALMTTSSLASSPGSRFYSGELADGA